MKDSRDKVIIRFLCTKTNTKNFHKGKKFYSLFLHEDLYPMILSLRDPEGQKQSNFVLTQDTKEIFHKKTFLEMKRIIMFFRSNKSFQKYSFDNSLSSKKKKFFQFILENIAFFLLVTQEKDNTLEKKHISVSVHKPLEYIENQWQYHSFGFHGIISPIIHPEIMLRILRKKIQDISLLHLIRIFLHIDIYSLEGTFKDPACKRVRSILRNIYVVEIDKFFFSESKDNHIFNKYKYASSNEWLSCLQKIQNWTSFRQKEQYRTVFSKNLRKNFFYLTKRKLSFLENSKTYKYLRTNTLWFLFFQKKKRSTFLIKGRIIRFFSQRLGYVLTVKRLTPIFARNSYFFLAYIFQFTKKRNFVRINTNFFLLMNLFIINYVAFINPLFLIIRALTRQNFCTSFGYPKSKSGWVTWTDSKIIEHFIRIRNTFFLFYSGCNNRKALYRIQYILYYSCAKTLACKHKTNLRKICKKFGSNLSLKGSFYNSNKFPKNNFYNNPKVSRLWNFQLKQMDSILFLFEQIAR